MQGTERLPPQCLTAKARGFIAGGAGGHKSEQLQPAMPGTGKSRVQRSDEMGVRPTCHVCGSLDRWKRRGQRAATLPAGKGGASGRGEGRSPATQDQGAQSEGAPAARPKKRAPNGAPKTGRGREQGVTTRGDQREQREGERRTGGSGHDAKRRGGAPGACRPPPTKGDGQRPEPKGVGQGGRRN